MATKQTVTPQEIMKKSAAYIEKTQPVIDEYNDMKAGFAKRATQSAGGLSSLGFINKNDVNKFIDKVAADPTAVWDFIDKLAETAASADSFGGEAGITPAITGGGDAFERAYFPEVFARGNSGMID